jgi:hypothetical protein
MNNSSSYDDEFDPNWVLTRTNPSDRTHIPLLTTEEKEYLRLASLPETASSRRHQVEGANNGGRRRGRRISRRRLSRRRVSRRRK